MAKDKSESKKERNTFLNGHVWWKYLISVIACIVYLLPIWVTICVSFTALGDNSSRLYISIKDDTPDPLTGNRDESGLFWLGNYGKTFGSTASEADYQAMEWIYPNEPRTSDRVIPKGNYSMLNAIKNSAILMVGVILVEVVTSAFAAYPLSRNRSKLNKFLLSAILGVMMIPGLSIVVGVYQEFVTFGMINTYWGIILITAAFGLPMCIYLYSNFIRTIPDSLDEAAAIDGAGPGQTFFRVLLPQLKPVTVTVIIMRGIGAWNEYTYSLYILQKPSMMNVSLTIKQYFSENLTDYGAAAAAAILAIIPVIAVYLFLQRYFIQGAVDSAVKG